MAENSAKLDNQLNLALDVSNQVRQQTLDLDVGYNQDFSIWELIIRYTGNIDAISKTIGFDYVVLLNQFAVITIREDRIRALSASPEIIFVEKPKRLSYEVLEAIPASCIPPVQIQSVNLTGRGVLVAIIDSGIDYLHPDFRNEDGTTRIVALWDQTIQGTPPEGYGVGTLYTQEQINAALATNNRAQAMSLVPSTDTSGHGTHVAGIACGGGRADPSGYRGVAFESEMLIVKLGSTANQSYPDTAQLMQGVNFCIQEAQRLGKPVAINVSYGNNYGSHTGQSVLEDFINSACALWKTSIVIGTGNEGGARTHTSGTLSPGVTTLVELPVSQYQFTFNLQIWKNFSDHFDVRITDPSGNYSVLITEIQGTQRLTVATTKLYVFYGEPQPINSLQEIYIEFIPNDDYVSEGIWKIELEPKVIITGRYDMWLPAGGVLNRDTGFLRPVETTTLTIPSTASLAITVGAYDSLNDSYAYFSGRGYTRNDQIKPDLVAPGVNIISAAPNGGYTQRTGTSMATPFVTGTCALMMQWGIVEGNDPYLYGEKIKAYLINGARKLPIEASYPNPTLGWGALCVKNSLPI